MRRIIICFFLLLTVIGCVDRLFYDVPAGDLTGLSISGHIDNQPGPYRINIFRNFDIDSKETIKAGLSVRSVVISDNEGNSEKLSQVESGVYETSTGGIRGRVGGIYKLSVELLDGRKYESVPDTLRETGTIDSVYYKLEGRQVDDGFIYEVLLYANSSTESDVKTNRFLWENKTTYKSKTKPLDEYPGGLCYLRPDGNCNFVAPCSGYVNIGTGGAFIGEYDSPCTCCICWYDKYSQSVLLNDSYDAINGKYNDVLVDRVEVTGWNLQYKLRLEVSMQSLSPQAYEFWKDVRDQRAAVNNIFQPVTGKISGNIREVTESGIPAQGIFYATATTTRALYIARGEIREELIPSIEFKKAGAFPCNKLAPNSTTTQPSFWID